MGKKNDKLEIQYIYKNQRRKTGTHESDILEAQMEVLKGKEKQIKGNEKKRKVPEIYEFGVYIRGIIHIFI